MYGGMLTVAHTPDSDDAFMFYGIAVGAIEIEGFRGVKHIIEDIETLNRWLVEEGRNVDASAVSAHAYAYLINRYFLLRTGASMGEGYGPVVVARKDGLRLEGSRIALPGRYTTAGLLLTIALKGKFTPVYARFDEIPGLVEEGKVDAGLLIHEEQIAYSRRGLTVVLDLWDWWARATGGLPMPLGVDVFSKRLGRSAAAKFRDALRRSIEYAYQHFDEALEYSMRYSRVKDRELVARFIRMYVNERTLDMGEDGVEAHRTLYKLAREAGVLKVSVQLGDEDIV
ncbi:MqnA/MqnD/SBP family protein [Aeropyrum camini]|uniref:1,4-dihydroxy-6-naphtoate synthase n=1 Tax=Aeropyrum camini SY1 = JCM 12091 TaxID=1198449 RepID=U3TCI5_9CREN|nr:MqnA/MqnD/SBP family protein [Aeropyrum camini]BAN89658.1 predicted periplasmic solute-binding protein [Aeropyrum camini SY1 = JCM 12091]